MRKIAFKNSVVYAFVTGVLYTTGMYGFDVFSNTVGDPRKYIHLFVFFGGIMGAFDYYKAIKKLRRHEGTSNEPP